MNFADSPIWVERKYANLVSSRLNLFKVKKESPFLANFRCHVCNDSQTNKLKARGYLYEKDSHIHFKCQNCGASHGFGYFLKTVDHTIYEEYRLECIKETGTKKVEWKPDIGKFTKPRFSHYKQLESLKKISQLPQNHPALLYVRERKIPSHTHYKLYYAPKFAAWVNTIVPDKLETEFDEPRLIIPFIDQNGYLFGFQGRSFKKNTKLRYITIMLDETKPKVFGLDKVKPSEDVYILEGPLDSLFLPNSLAMAGSDVSISTLVSKEKAVVVYDNEPRSKEICKKILTTIDHGYRVFVWPDKWSAKDINDLVLTGVEPAEILEEISKNTFKGLAALARFNAWKKVTL